MYSFDSSNVQFRLHKVSAKPATMFRHEVWILKCKYKKRLETYHAKMDTRILMYPGSESRRILSSVIASTWGEDGDRNGQRKEMRK
jgi:hypothetical protein